MKKTKGKDAYLYILPMFLFFAVFLIYPLINTVWLSFHEWNGIDVEKPFIGLQNYIEMFQDQQYGLSMQFK